MVAAGSGEAAQALLGKVVGFFAVSMLLALFVYPRLSLPFIYY